MSLSLRLTSVLLICLLLIAIALPAAASPKDYPDSAIALMDIKFKCNCSRTGAGVMVGRRGLLTAGHNLICATHGKGASTIRFRFGVKAANDCLLSVSSGWTYWYYTDFTDSSGKVSYDSKWDIGYVRFDKNVGDTTGWYGTMAPSDHDLSWEYFHLTSYAGTSICYEYSTVDPIDSYRFTFNRMSTSIYEGAPIFVQDEGSYPTVLGIYTSHSSDKSYARRLTNQIIADMRSDGVVE